MGTLKVQMLARLVAAVVLLNLVAGAALARDFTAAEKDALAARVDAFGLAMSAKDYDTVLGVTPPRIHQMMAAKAGITVAELRSMVVGIMEEAMAVVTIERFATDLDATRYAVAGDGAPYALIPTEVVLDAGENGRFLTKSETLAFIDEGVWYLVRVDEIQQVIMLRDAYPQFVGVEFSSGSTQALQ